jgi:DNA invertase Pin-like site-specific DNA recombinase
MKVKYNRVSTSNQSGARFEMDTDFYDLVLLDTITGTIKMQDRPKGKQLLKLTRAGKVAVVVVDELSRLGRNSYDILTTLNTLRHHNVNVVVRSLGISSYLLDGTYNPSFELISTIYSWVAQQEREGIIERTSQGRQIAKLKGVKFGRPLGSNETNREFLSKPKCQKIVQLLKLGRPIREIAKATETSTATTIKVKKVATTLGQLDVV